jgi:1-acyl-sn-glycerol-3-phosphate acyltransferase
MFAVRVWTVFGAIAPLTWALMLALPGENRRWRVMRAAVRSFFALAGLHVQVFGRGNVPVDTPFVAVANHASYLDGLVALVALPCPATFVVKADFARYRYTLGLMMRRIGVIFVSHDRPDTRRLIDAAKGGRSLMLFPEGGIETSFRLAPFHQGAFVIATCYEFPVLPMTIQGTRRALPPGTWRPRHASITVQFGSVISPVGTGTAAIRTLHEATRRTIAAQLNAIIKRQLGKTSGPPQ